MKHTDEKAIAGVTSGLINLNESVTWKAKHLFKNRFLETKITAMSANTFFEDEMVKGDFKMMRHEHHFSPADEGTLMVDHFVFETLFGLAGNVVNFLFLKWYMRKLLIRRNRVIKDFAETEKWKDVL